MAKLQPDGTIVVVETGRECRVALIVRDGSNRFWGLTARHVFEGRPTAKVRGADGATLGTYREDENDFGFAENEAPRQIVRFALPAAAIGPEKVATGVTWPRSATDEESALGAQVVTNAPVPAVIGTVVAVDSVEAVEFVSGAPTKIEGVTLVELDDRALLKPGLAGMLLISPAGEAVGLGFAARHEERRATIIASPLASYLERTKLRPWAPGGAHWSDLPRRARDFLREVTAQGAPDLGRPPVEDRI